MPMDLSPLLLSLAQPRFSATMMAESPPALTLPTRNAPPGTRRAVARRRATTPRAAAGRARRRSQGPARCRAASLCSLRPRKRGRLLSSGATGCVRPAGSATFSATGYIPSLAFPGPPFRSLGY